MFGRRFSQRTTKFLLNQGGALAISFAIAAPALMVVAGMATDYAFMVRYRTELQAVADAAAIAGAREMTLAQSDASQVGAVVESYITVNAKDRGSPVTTTTQVNAKDATVDVSLSQAWAPFFLHFVEDGVTPIVVNATAKSVGAEKVCVIGLDESAADTVHLTDNANMTANNCAVYSNSVASNALEAVERLSQEQPDLHSGWLYRVIGFVRSATRYRLPQDLRSPRRPDSAFGRFVRLLQVQGLQPDGDAFACVY